MSKHSLIKMVKRLSIILFAIGCLSASAQPEEMWDSRVDALVSRMSGVEVDSEGNLLVGQGTFGPRVAVVSSSGSLQGTYTISDGPGGTIVVRPFDDRKAVVMASRTINGIRYHSFMSFEIDQVVALWPYARLESIHSGRFRAIWSVHAAFGVTTPSITSQDRGWCFFEYRWGNSEGVERPQIPFPTGIPRGVTVRTPFIEHPMSPGGAASLIFSTYDNPAAYPHPVWMRT